MRERLWLGVLGQSVHGDVSLCIPIPGADLARLSIICEESIFVPVQHQSLVTYLTLECAWLVVLRSTHVGQVMIPQPCNQRDNLVLTPNLVLDGHNSRLEQQLGPRNSPLGSSVVLTPCQYVSPGSPEGSVSNSCHLLADLQVVLLLWRLGDPLSESLSTSPPDSNDTSLI